jgi:predicted Rossmann-fold nucleotide-binding protein
MKSNMLKNGFISPNDLNLITVTDDPDEAVQIILDYVQRVGPPVTRPKTLG